MSATSDLYTIFGTLLTTSKNLVTALEKSDWLDRLLILSSLVFFLLAVAYILKKRVIDKGIWLAFWWVKYLPFPTSRSLATPATPSPQGALSQTKEFVTAAASLVATSLIVATSASSTTRIPDSLAEEISSLASAAFEFEHPEPTDISILAGSIIEDVLSRAAETGSHETILEADGNGDVDIPPQAGKLDVGMDAPKADHAFYELPPSAPLSTKHIHEEL